jgi:protein-S-isoprenylcysteine O-methyltransferase Ste14
MDASEGKKAPARAGSALWLTIRSMAWALLLPGVVTVFIPWRYFGLAQVRLDPARPTHVLGLLGAGIGAGLLAACIVEFARSGRGTLVPVDAPRRLVVRGLYRYVRNPMYLSGTVILLSECLITGSRALLLYWAAWFTAVNLFVIAYEEPTLRRRFGAEYEAYVRRVHRWIPRVGRRARSE